MRLLHVLNAVCSDPWPITADGMQRVVDLLNSKLGESVPVTAYSYNPPGGSDDEGSQMRVKNGTATIPIHGTLGNRVSALAKSCGVRDYADIASELREAAMLAKSGQIQRAVLDVDSPGGQASGLPPVAKFIAGFQAATGKPVYAHVTGQAGSAALWLASGADWIVADEGTTIGSVGAMIAFRDTSKAMEKEGVRVVAISSSEFKTAGLPGTSLTDKQKAYLQERVEEIASDFRAHIRSRRPDVSEEALDGRVFSAKQAQRLGLVDTLTVDFDALLAGA